MNILDKLEEATGKLFYLTEKDVEVLNTLTALDGNREIKETKVRELCKAISSGKYIGTLLVDEITLQVIEGNHRLCALRRCAENGIPFKVRIELYDFKSPLAAARLINNTGTKWSKQEKLYSFVIEGKEQYVKLNNFIRNNNLLSKRGGANITAALILLSGGNTSKSDIDFKEGNLNFTDANYEKAEDIISDIDILEEAFPYCDFYKKEALVGFIKFRADYLINIETRKRFFNNVKDKYIEFIEPVNRTRDWYKAFKQFMQ